MSGEDALVRQEGGALERLAARAGGTTGALLLVTLVNLVAAFGLKSYCLTSWDPKRQPKSCYNDFQYLWYLRRLFEHLPPWSGDATMVRSDGRVVSVILAPGQLEYPVVTSVFAWLTSLFANSAASFLVVSALALAPFALVTTFALGRLAERRALLFAATPQLTAYAFLNWDLLPVAAAAGGLWAWLRGRPGLAALLLTVGAWAKIWPGFLLVPLLLHLLLEHRRRDAVRVVGISVVVSAALNVPFALASPGAWLAPFRMQSFRANDGSTNSLWLILWRVDLTYVNLFAGVAVLVAWGLILAFTLRRGGQGPERWVAAGAAMVSSYMLLGRVDSPQYGLWLLPFLVLLAVPTRLLVVFLASDLFLWLTWSWLWSGHDFLHPPAVVLRVVVLAVLTVAFLRAPLVTRSPAADGSAPAGGGAGSSPARAPAGV